MRSSIFLWRSGTDTRRIEITRLGGNLDRFYHFILDLVWPLFEWAKGEKVPLAGTTLLPQEVSEHHFAPVLNSLLGMRMEAMPAVMPQETAAPVVLHGFNTKSGDHWRTFPGAAAFRDARLGFVRGVAERFGDVPHAPASVVLIERKLEAGDRGASRRGLQGHEGLASALAEWCTARGLVFHSVRLEDLHIRSQFALFHGGPVVLIGQHGAGLVNGLWMTDPYSAVVELAGADNPPHFTNLFNDLGMRYARLACEGSGDHMAGQRIMVDHRALLAVLEPLTALIRSDRA